MKCRADGRQSVSVITSIRFRAAALKQKINAAVASFICLMALAIALICAAILIIGAITAMLISRHMPF